MYRDKLKKKGTTKQHIEQKELECLDTGRRNVLKLEVKLELKLEANEEGPNHNFF